MTCLTADPPRKHRCDSACSTYISRLTHVSNHPLGSSEVYLAALLMEMGKSGAAPVAKHKDPGAWPAK